MALPFRLTQDAKLDLINIRRYTVQQWGIEQSRKYITKLRKTIQLLSENPLLGKPRPEVGDDVASFPYASHVIYYIMNRQQLVVFGILHKHMVPNKHLNKRGEI
jgi:toxin ParE1/3/4